MTSDLSDLLSPDFVLVDLAASSKKALFQQLGQVAGPALGLDAATVTSALAERERLGSTGFGGGVAIPHARMFSPPEAGADHLKALARVSRRFRDREFVDKLRGAASRDAFYALLAADETRDAA